MWLHSMSYLLGSFSAKGLFFLHLPERLLEASGWTCQPLRSFVPEDCQRFQDTFQARLSVQPTHSQEISMFNGIPGIG